MIEPPVFISNEDRISTGDGSLFHYTKFDSFIKIIETMTLRSSPIKKLNDLNEANIDNLDWGGEFLSMMDARRYVKEKCSVISFTKNYKIGSNYQYGSNHPSMWAHYADDSNGVCMVLDKHLLNELNKKSLKGVFNKTEVVKYCHCCSPDDAVMNNLGNDSSEFVRKNYRELFFKKHLDWKSEREVRFFAESPELYLNIKGAIKYIILGERLSKDKDRLIKIVEQIISPGTQSYHYLIPRSFAEMRPSPYGYFLGQADYLIESVMGQMMGMTRDYLDWVRTAFR